MVRFSCVEIWMAFLGLKEIYKIDPGMVFTISSTKNEQITSIQYKRLVNHKCNGKWQFSYHTWHLSGFVTLLITYGYFSNLCVPIFWWDYIGVGFCQKMHHTMGSYFHNFYCSTIIKFWTSKHAWNRQDIIFVYFLLKPYVRYVFEMENIEHFGFIQFYTDNWSVEPKQTFVLVFCGQLKLRQKLVHVGFFGKLIIVSFSILMVNHWNVSLLWAWYNRRNK